MVIFHSNMVLAYCSIAYNMYLTHVLYLCVYHICAFMTCMYNINKLLTGGLNRCLNESIIQRGFETNLGCIFDKLHGRRNILFWPTVIIP